MRRLYVWIPSPPDRAPRQHLDAELLLAWVRDRGFDGTAFDPAVSSRMPAEVLEEARHQGAVVYWHLPSAADLRRLEETVDDLGEPSSALMIAGGSFAQTFDREILERVPGLDGVVRGELERPVLGLLEAMDRGDGEAWKRTEGLTVRTAEGTRRNPISQPGVDLGDIPRAADDLFHPDRLQKGQRVLLSRGCNSDCSYCGLQTVYRESFPGRSDFWRSRPPGAAVDEMEYFAREHGVGLFHLYAFVTLGYDATGTELLHDVADELIRRELDVRFTFVTHPGHLVRNGDLLPRLRRAGLASVSLGLDSGSQSVLDRFRVPFRLEDSLGALRLLHRHQVPFNPQLIFYEPRMSLDEVGENLAFLRRIAPWFSHLPQPYSVFLYRDLLARPLQVSRLTPVHRELREDGLWEPPESWTDRGRTYFLDRRVERFFRGHQRIVQPILRDAAGTVFDRDRCTEEPDLALLPLDLLDRWLDVVQADDLSDEEAARQLSSRARYRLEGQSVTTAPLRVAGARS